MQTLDGRVSSDVGDSLEWLGIVLCREVCMAFGEGVAMVVIITRHGVAHN